MKNPHFKMKHQVQPFSLLLTLYSNLRRVARCPPPKINELTCNHGCEPVEKFAAIADMRQSGTERVASG